LKVRLKYGEKGIFITIQENIAELSKQFLEFGYDLEKLQEEGKILVIRPKIKVEEGEDLFQQITYDEFKEKISSFKAERIAIDPLNLILQFSADYGGERREIERLIHEYKSLGCTLLLTHERTTDGPPNEIEYGPEDFVSDGIIYLQAMRKGGIFDKKKIFFERTLTILKMRETDHGQGIYRFKIEEDGIHVYS
jgi:KaiC/GvpD/RAD55 family RecA-like ATPase